MNNVKRLLPGLGVCAIIGIAAHWLSSFTPLGGVAIAIVLGILTGNTFRPGPASTPGISFSAKTVLSGAIVLMGINLNFTIIRDMGPAVLMIIALGLAATITAAVILGRLTGLDRRLALLLGIGSGICGSSAIGAAAPLIGADRDQTGISVAVVNFLGTLGIFILPVLSTKLLGLSPSATAVYIGNTLQAVGQVAAAGFSAGTEIGRTAILVKMVRILMLTPVLLVLTMPLFRSGPRAARTGTRLPGIPPFIIGFILCSLAVTFGLVPDPVRTVLSRIGHWLLITAMAAIGLQITFRSLVKSGGRALLAGSLVFLCQILVSGVLIFLFIASSR